VQIKLLALLLAFFSWLPLLAAESGAPAPSNPVAVTAQVSPDPADSTVRFFNRNIITFRSSLYGVSAPARARRAQIRLHEQLDKHGPHKVTQKAEAQGIMLQIDAGTTFWVTPDDAETESGETLQALADNTAAVLERVIAESRESRDIDSITRALGQVAMASAVALALAWLISRILRRLEHILSKSMHAHAAQVQLGGIQLLHQSRGVVLINKTLKGLFRLLMFVLAYKWLSFVLASFPFTRAWGELLDDYLWSVASSIGTGVVGAIPGLFIALVIFYLAHTFTRLMDNFFSRIRNDQIHLTWLEAEVAEPTRRIAKTVVWLFALAMAYPYLPGSDTEAFKGLSVLVGLMLSLGASNLVGQLASGLILTYTRTFHNGEFVRIDHHEGTVMNLGAFTTRIRTGMGEELTISNSQVLGAVTRNYSRAVKGRGYIVDTTVTIGYDTPWRQVNAMLTEAALRTPGVLADPPPVVFQTTLSDFYPEYRLVCQAMPDQPRPRAEVLSLLHANIQDVFNQYGVQIMSPNYRGDPAEPKLVPPERWYTAPARPPRTPDAPDPSAR
jgi:small-conductance mechanosensitive channel